MARHDKLLGLMREKGLSQREVAGRIGVCETTMGRKLAGKSAFRDREIVAMSQLLGIPDGEIGVYFFCPKTLQTERLEG